MKYIIYLEKFKTMKKILLVLMIVPMIGFGQTAKEYFDKGLEYGENGEFWLSIDNLTKSKALSYERII